MQQSKLGLELIALKPSAFLWLLLLCPPTVMWPLVLWFSSELDSFCCSPVFYFGHHQYHYSVLLGILLPGRTLYRKPGYHFKGVAIFRTSQMRSYKWHPDWHLFKPYDVLGIRPVVFIHHVHYFSEQISEMDMVIILIQQVRKLKLGV